MCDFKASLTQNLSQPIEKTHNTKICEVTTKSKATLRDHPESKHSNVVNLCDQCEYKTTTTLLLKRHQIVFMKELYTLVSNVTTSQTRMLVLSCILNRNT